MPLLHCISTFEGTSDSTLSEKKIFVTNFPFLTASFNRPQPPPPPTPLTAKITASITFLLERQKLYYYQLCDFKD